MSIKIKRLIAFSIDLLPCIILIRELTPTIYHLIPNNNIFQIIFSIIYYFLWGIIICMKDCIFDTKSIGKKVMNLKIVDSHNQTVKNKKILFIRNFYSLFNIYFPLYPYMILIFNKSFGDIKTKLEVKED